MLLRLGRKRMDVNKLIKSYKFKKVLPYPHQVRALQRALSLKSTALFMEPGTGKTRVAVDFIGIKHQSVGIQKVLVVCPKVALGVWQDQINEYLPRGIKRNVVILDNSWGSIKDRIAEAKNHKKVDCLTFFLVNYDVLADQKRWDFDGNITVREGMRNILKKWRPDVIILDESHYIKKHSSARSRAIHTLSSVPKWKLILSGTPITNSPLDLFSQYKFADDRIFGTRWASFRNKFAIMGGFGGHQVMGIKNKEKLRKRMQLISFECTKKELNLPGKLPSEIVRIPMTPKTRKLYDQMEKEMIIELEELGKKATATIILTKLIRLRQIAGGFVRVTNEDLTKEDVPVGTEKLDALRELLDIHCKAGGYKVVVFAQFKWEVAQIKSVCDRISVPAIVDRGLIEERRRFRDDKTTMVYIVPLSMGGISVNELVAAHIGIFYSLNYSSDKIIQAMDRLDRIGQTEPVFFQFLAMDKSIDLTMVRSFVENKSIADEVTYGVKEKMFNG